MKRPYKAAIKKRAGQSDFKMDGVGQVDYRNYRRLLEHYKEVDNLTFDGNETKQDIIDRLMEVSKEKKKIQTENNEIIKEYITKYVQTKEIPKESLKVKRYVL